MAGRMEAGRERWRGARRRRRGGGRCGWHGRDAVRGRTAHPTHPTDPRLKTLPPRPPNAQWGFHACDDLPDFVIKYKKIY